MWEKITSVCIVKALHFSVELEVFSVFLMNFLILHLLLQMFTTPIKPVQSCSASVSGDDLSLDLPEEIETIRQEHSKLPNIKHALEPITSPVTKLGARLSS